MNKNEFLSEIARGLEGLPKSDIDKTLEYYTEIIDDRMEDGESEEDAVAELGAPADICRQILLDTPLPRLVAAKAKPSRTLRTWEIVLLAVCSPMWVPLLFAAVITVAAVFFALWSVIVSLYFTAFMIGVSSLAYLAAFGAALVNGNALQAAFNIGGALICFGLSVFMFLGMNKLAALTVRLCRAILRGIKSVFVSKK